LFRFIRLARRLSNAPEFRRLVVAIADELERVEVLEQADLIRIYEATQEATTCST